MFNILLYFNCYNMNKVASSAIGCFKWKKREVITSFHLEHKLAICFKICKTCTAKPFINYQHNERYCRK